MKFDKRLNQFKLVTIVCIYYEFIKMLKVSHTSTQSIMNRTNSVMLRNVLRFQTQNWKNSKGIVQSRTNQTLSK